MDWGILPASQTSRRLRTGVCVRERNVSCLCVLYLSMRFGVRWTIDSPNLNTCTPIFLTVRFSLLPTAWLSTWQTLF